MRFLETGIAGAWLIEPEPHLDDRGRFMRAWCADEFSRHGIDFLPLQGNAVFSKARGTLRGLHFQKAPAIEAKLVRCTRGAVFDLVLDLRVESTTYRKWYAAQLTPENGKMLYVPERCAHGCQALADDTEIYYLASEYYTPGMAFGARYDDPAFAIDWPLPATAVSHQDRTWPLLSGEILQA